MREEVRSRNGRSMALPKIKTAWIERAAPAEMAGKFSRRNLLRWRCFDGSQFPCFVCGSRREVEDLGLWMPPEAGLSLERQSPSAEENRCARYYCRWYNAKAQATMLVDDAVKLNLADSNQLYLH